MVNRLSSQYRGFSVATGGSGHRFKFQPVVGEYIFRVLDGASRQAGRSEQTSQMKETWR
ncbi:uncharacterized protein BDV17DRAFT_276559, partial [Aspergillus undulatus]|uniref:uncharacterized protein n=1 Tax=Aspergillus undulatus TaxID=1810928 RepID=UPI003CCDE8C9